MHNSKRCDLCYHWLWGRSKSIGYLCIIEVKLLSVYPLKAGYCNYKMFYVSPKITTEKIPIEDTQKKMRKESKCVTTKRKKKVNETQNKTREEVQKSYNKTENDEQNSNSKPFPQ